MTRYVRTPGLANTSTLAPAGEALAGGGARATADALAPTLGCLREDEILAYRDGQTSEEERARIHEHLDACATCSDLLLLIVADFAGSSEGIAGGVALGPKAFSPGTLLARRYRVERFVGQGGMGEVYEGVDTLLRTRVAIKTVLSTACDNLRAARKLFDEVRNAQRVTHPHVCRINELHTHPGADAPIHFLTMEFVDGECLSARRKRMGGVLPPEEVRELSRQLLEGLCAAHAKGVVHLDFKGDNVMLRSGAVLDAVIMDFGLSRMLDAEARLRTSEQLQLAGTLRYMAPEQLECRPDIGPAADVYAFGVVLYESLTGQLPFDGASLSAILLKQLKQKPSPPSKALPSLSPSVDEFVLGCLAPDRATRFADAGAALAAFARIGNWHTTRRWPRWRYALACSLCFAAVLGGASRYLSFAAVPGVEPAGSARAPEQAVEPISPTPAPPRETPAARQAVTLADSTHEGTAVGPSSPGKRPAVRRNRSSSRVASRSSSSTATDVADSPQPPLSPPEQAPAAEVPMAPVAPTVERRSKLPGAPGRFLEPAPR